jgi:CubicO group peptidase (beta-lactamase class C family)
MNSSTSPRFSLLLAFGLVIELLAGCGPPATKPAKVNAETCEKFEAKLEYLRQQMKIPGMSAAVIMDQKLVWAKGFGYADLENRVEATPDTPYNLASVTKTVAATLVMQLVQEGVISLDDPVSKYGVELESQGTILVWHLLTHTSTGVPGTTYIYDGVRCAYLGQIAERATGKSFGTLMQERILDRLGMTNSWMDYPRCAIALGQSPYPIDWHGREFEAAKPYQLNQSYEIVEGRECTVPFSAAAGLISTVVDLAKFDIALDQNVLLTEETKAEMLAPAVPMVPNRPDLSHGLGWYSMEYMGTRLNWHSGWCAPSVSANIIKAPEQGLTFIVMANTDHLSVPYPHVDITYSTLGQAFYETFVYPRQSGQTVPEVNWEAGREALVDQLGEVTNSDLRQILERELWAYRQLFASLGKRDLADQLLNVHRQVYPDSSPSSLDLYTCQGLAYDVSPTLVSDQVQPTEAELERLAGEYILSDTQANSAGLPLEARFEAISGRIVVAFAGGCVDLVAITPTRFTTPDRETSVVLRMNGEEVERAVVNVGGVDAVYVPKE